MSQSAFSGTPLLDTDDVADIQFPPGNLLSDEPPLETGFHRDQIDLLIRLLDGGGAIARIFMYLEI